MLYIAQTGCQWRYLPEAFGRIRVRHPVFRLLLASRRGFSLCDVYETMRDMAVVLHVSVAPATQDQFYELEARVEQSMMQAGGPPDGLMSHVVYPEGTGFVIAQVWRTEAVGRAYVDVVGRSLIKEVGLSAEETTVRPVWSFARP
jgi:hypothetical protein